MQLPIQALRIFHFSALLLSLSAFIRTLHRSGTSQRLLHSLGRGTTPSRRKYGGPTPESGSACKEQCLWQDASPSPLTGYQGIISMPRLLSFLLLALLLGERAAEAARMPDQQPLSPALSQEFTATADLTETSTSHEHPPAAEPGEHAKPESSAKAGTSAQENAGKQEQAVPADQSARDSAAAIISGSRKPGIIEHQYVRDEGGNPVISISYPSVGSKEIDSDIRQWVTGIATAFEQSCSNGSFAAGSSLDGDRPPFELWGSYSVTAPSPAGLSITFEVWTYTGGAHGNLDVITLNYSLLTGQRLGLVDLFEDPDMALNLMSAWSYKELSRRLGGMRQEQMLRTGLTPVPENFASLTLTPQGVRINFQPYQVAPWAAGAQKVDMPLDQLLPANPLLRLWGR
ncbi:MAG: DUF3298 domain-containing protein [Desulfovibrio sp.]|uniref:DUF3298 and DUF4163 domain-containing protein n=1 Tax=Desulfovibrio sp. TaxID=885 RepID=UPI0039E49943